MERGCGGAVESEAAAGGHMRDSDRATVDAFMAVVIGCVLIVLAHLYELLW